MVETNVFSWPGWETVGLIGRGSFGAVYEIRRNVLGNVEKAALKVISIPQSTSDIDEMYNDVHTGKLTCGYIFPEDLSERSSLK